MVFRHEFSSGNSLLQEILVLKFQELFVFHAVSRKFLRMTGFFSCFRDFFHLKNSCLDISAQEINRCQKSHKIVYLEHSNPYLICSMISIFQSAAPNIMKISTLRYTFSLPFCVFREKEVYENFLDLRKASQF